MKHPTWLPTAPTAVAVAVATVIGLVSVPALAQNTTSGISGVVTGADGKPVAGATVTIVHADSGSTSTVTTDDAGRYSARGLRAGVPYTITISKGGRTEKKEGLVLSLAETFSYDAQIGPASQVVTVTGRAGSDQFNKSSMGAGTSIGARELATFASIQRNLQDYARTDPRLARPTRNAAKSAQLAKTRATTASRLTVSPPTTPSAWKATTCPPPNSRSALTPFSRCRST